MHNDADRVECGRCLWVSKDGRAHASYHKDFAMDRQHALAMMRYPFATPVNPHRAQAQAHTEHWALARGLLPHAATRHRFQAAQFGFLAAATAPELAVVPLELVTDWCSWFFLHDDQCDEQPVGATTDSLPLWHAHIRDVLHGAALLPADSPLIRALADLRVRTIPYGDANAWQHYCVQLAQYFAAGEWEAANRAANRVPDLATYRAMRPLTGGLYAYVALLGLLAGETTAAPLAAQVATRAATEQAILVVSLCNDLVSLERELLHGDVHNLVLVLETHAGLPRAQAWAQTLALHNTTLAAFVVQARRLGATGTATERAQHQRVVQMLQALIRGSFDWTCATERHQAVLDARVVGAP